jgi:hypothetical protein
MDDSRRYGQARVIGQAQLGPVGLGADVSVLTGSGVSGWEDTRPGTVRLDARVFCTSRGESHALGVGVRGNFSLEVGFWVLQGADARQRFAPLLTWDVSVGEATHALSVRAQLGFAAAEGSTASAGLEGSGLHVLKVWPLAARWGVLTEGALQLDPTPIAVRAAARFSPVPSWTCDLGVQLPVLLLIEHPAVLPILSVRGAL